MGERCDPDAMHVIVIDKGDDITLYYFKDGLKEEKAVSLDRPFSLE